MGQRVNKRPAQRRKIVAGAVAAFLGLSFVAVVAANAAPGDGTVRVRVVQDVNANGGWEDTFLEPGFAGVSVTVTDSAGASQTLTTDSDGLVSFLGAPGAYRVQVTNPDPAQYSPALASEKDTPDTPAALRLSSTEEFVTVAADQTVNVTTGFWNSADYCQTNPLLVGACQQTLFDVNGNPVNRDAMQTLYTGPYRGTGQDSGVSTVATEADTGALYGIGYRKQDKRIFSGAFAKRATKYGPGGPGAIYVTRVGGSTTLWGTVPNVGTTVHGAGANHDLAFVGAVGKESLGDLDISEDGDELQVINLNTRQLFVYDASTPTAGTPLHVVDLSANPGCAAASDWRPFSLGERNDVVYVGGVCSAESTESRADLRAIILTFDAANGYAPLGKVMDQSLLYKRSINFHTGCPNNATTGQIYTPWTTAIPCSGQVGLLIDQPILSDIIVESDGNLLLGFRNRFGDMYADGLRYSSSVDGGLYIAHQFFNSGDTNKACKNPATGLFVIDANGACGIDPVAAGQVSGEYFTGDRPVAIHGEANFGALALSRRERGVATTSIDPYGEFGTSGYMRLARLTGKGLISANGGIGTNPSESTYENPTVTENNPGQAGGNSLSAADRYSKGQGLADLEVLCDLAPIQIGNRVWSDVDEDGVQDVGEAPISGVTVNLYNDAGALVATTVTNANGEYYFDSRNENLQANTSYVVRLDKAADYGPGGPLEGLTPTAADQGSGEDADRLDSDGTLLDGYSQVGVTTGDHGYVNHTLDFGFVPEPASVSVGDFVWLDSDGDGVQDGGEPGIQGVVLALTGPDGEPVTDVNGNPVGNVTTDADGKYSFGDLPVLEPGQSYTVSIVKDDPSTVAALAGLVPTQTGQGTPGTDSSTDSASSGDLTTDGAQDLTLDFGFVQAPPTPSVSVGDFVWLDSDGDGVQDGGEPGIEGVVLMLTGPGGGPVTDINGNPVGPVTTDADGKYSFANLPVLLPGMSYTVTIDPIGSAAALSGLVPTQTGQGTPGTDSSTGSATSGDLTTGGAQDLTLDFGFVQAPPTPSVSVGDFVWKDLDGDGVQDGGEPGIQGVVLTLTGPDGQPVTDVNGNPVGNVTTDADGKYSFGDLPVLEPGQSYTVSIVKDDPSTVAALAGLVPTQTGQGTPGTDSSTDSASSGDLTTDGAQDLTLDFGFVQAPPTPSVSVGDFVWLDSDGDGVQDGGEPGIQGVVLILTGPGGLPVTDVNGNPVGPTSTDENGNYSFDELPVLPAGMSYTVTIDPIGSAAALSGLVPTQTGQGTPGTDSSTGSATSGDLTTGGAQDLTLDFGFVQAPPTPSVSVGDFVWKDLDGDGVQDGGEPGIQGVVLTLTGPDGQPVTDVNGNPVGNVTTDADGKYSFGDLPVLEPGQSYTVSIVKDDPSTAAALAGLVPTQTGQGTPGTDSSTDSASSGDLTTDGAQDLTLDFGFVQAPPTPSVSVGDFVWLDSDGDGVQDGGEPGIQGVVLILTGPDGQPVTDVFGNPVGNVTTDENGLYSFDDLPVLEPGQSYTVSIVKDDPSTVAALAGLVPTLAGEGPGDTDSSTDTASSGDLTTDGAQDLTLDFGFVQAPPTPSVSVGDFVWKDLDGDGVQDGGEPGIQGVVLTLTGPDGQPVTDVNGNPVGNVTTDADGKYSFGDLPVLEPGQSYTVSIVKDDPSTAAALAGLVPTQTGQGTPGTDSSTDSASSGDLTTGGASDNTLDFGFAPTVTPTPSVSVGDFVWKDLDGDGVQDGGEPGIEGVVLILTGPDGQPVTDVNGNPVGNVTTDADGKYSFGDLPVLEPGQSYTVSIVKDDPSTVAALAGLVPTQTGQGTPGTDSSTDSATSGDLTTGGASDNTLDFGFAPTVTPTPSVSVGDFVWFDKNGNGIQNAGEPGIQGVVLTIRGPDGQPVRDLFGNVVGPVTTDSQGKYLFTNLPVLEPGQSYTVRIDKNASAEALDGFRPTKAGAGGPGSDSSTGSATTHDLTVDGAQDLTIDFGYQLVDGGVSGPGDGDGDGDGVDGGGVEGPGSEGLPDTGAPYSARLLGVALLSLILGAHLLYRTRRTARV